MQIRNTILPIAFAATATAAPLPLIEFVQPVGSRTITVNPVGLGSVGLSNGIGLARGLVGVQPTLVKPIIQPAVGAIQPNVIVVPQVVGGVAGVAGEGETAAEAEAVAEEEAAAEEEATIAEEEATAAEESAAQAQGEAGAAEGRVSSISARPTTTTRSSTPAASAEAAIISNLSRPAKRSPIVNTLVSSPNSVVSESFVPGALGGSSVTSVNNGLGANSVVSSSGVGLGAPGTFVANGLGSNTVVSSNGLGGSTVESINGANTVISNSGLGGSNTFVSSGLGGSTVGSFNGANTIVSSSGLGGSTVTESLAGGANTVVSNSGLGSTVVSSPAVGLAGSVSPVFGTAAIPGNTVSESIVNGLGGSTVSTTSNSGLGLGLGNTVTTSVDALGNTVINAGSSGLGLGAATTTTSVDALGNTVVSESIPQGLGSTTSTSIDALGNTVVTSSIPSNIGLGAPLAVPGAVAIPSVSSPILGGAAAIGNAVIPDAAATIPTVVVAPEAAASVPGSIVEPVVPAAGSIPPSLWIDEAVIASCAGCAPSIQGFPVIADATGTVATTQPISLSAIFGATGGSSSVSVLDNVFGGVFRREIPDRFRRIARRFVDLD